MAWWQVTVLCLASVVYGIIGLATALGYGLDHSGWCTGPNEWMVLLAGAFWPLTWLATGLGICWRCWMKPWMYRARIRK